MVEHTIHPPSQFDGTQSKANCLIVHLNSPVTVRVSVDDDSLVRRLVPGGLPIIHLATRIYASFAESLEILVLRFDNVSSGTTARDGNGTGQALMSVVDEEMKQGRPTLKAQSDFNLYRDATASSSALRFTDDIQITRT